MNDGKEAIDKIREKINVLLNAFSWTNTTTWKAETKYYMNY